MAGLNFNAETVDPQTSFDPIPPDWYNCIIEESEMKPTQKNGAYLQLKLKVLDGQYANRVIFDRLNLNCPTSEVAQEIAYKTLSAICHAVNVIQVQDSNQLHNIPLQVKVSVRAADGEYDASNEVKGYKAFEAAAGVGGAAPGVAPTMGQAPAQPMAAPQQPMQQPMQQPTAAPQQQPAMAQAPAQAAPQFEPPAQQPAQAAPHFQAPAQQAAPAQQPAQQAAPAQQAQPAAIPADPALVQPQAAPGNAEAPPWAQPQQ